MTRRFAVGLAAALVLTVLVPMSASATPVCTDGYMGGPPLAACGGRIFPEAAVARSYIQYNPDPATGFREYQHGIEYLAEKYPRWISVFSFREHFKTPLAVSAGEDGIRSYEKGDTKDGHDIWVVKITDHQVPDKEKLSLFFSLSVHGNERGGLEGGMRTAEDLAIAADGEPDTAEELVDGIDNYETTTGRKPKFHTYDVREVLRKEVVYLVSFNIDGWQVGDHNHQPPLPYTRGNSLGTDLNRQMPTVGRINESRNPLQESEMKYGHKLMHEVAKVSGGRMAHAADLHGELTSNAYVDIMYPAGQFDSVDHRRLMAIAERTKSVIDETLYQGIVNEAEEGSGGNSSSPDSDVPTKPAHWATVWDTLGYTDTGFIGDYMATDLAVTGMDYEFFLNHTVPEKTWNVYMQENHINGARALIKVAMAYALYQDKEFNKRNLDVETNGRAGYVFNPDTVTDRDKNGAGVLPGPAQDGIGADGKPIKQRHYSVTNMKWFKDTSRVMPTPFVKVLSADVARSGHLDRLDTLVLADTVLPKDAKGRRVKSRAYFSNIKSWVKRGGNLVLTDRAVHALAKLGVVDKGATTDIKVYLPYADIQDLEHPMVAGLRPNARQLVEAAILGYCIGNTCSPMTIVDEAAFTEAGGHVVGTTEEGQVSVGQLKLGKGQIRVIGGALPTPTEEFDHRYGLRDYAMTYSGLYIMENSIRHDAPGLGARPASALPAFLRVG
ncbi:MAG TPA: M14 family zinc carboxypeptidase [Actinomycetota bacterium]|nr:M14 family zinc carboxypeptidase [Actinomycetota bacterium]